MPCAQPESSGTWTGRARVAGVLNESKAGFRTNTQAKAWASTREDAVKNSHQPRGKGSTRTRVAEALLTLGAETLPYKKRAVAEATASTSGCAWRSSRRSRWCPARIQAPTSAAKARKPRRSGASKLPRCQWSSSAGWCRR